MMVGYSINGWRGYAAAAGLVALAAIVRLGLGLVDARVLNFATFYPAIVLATLLSGYRCGIFSLVLATAIAWVIFLPPDLSFAVADHITLINVAIFVAMSGVLIWLTNSYRESLISLKAEKDLRDLLLEEVRHRSRNSIAVARTIVDNSLKDDPATAATINGRLATLLSAESLLMQESGASERLQTILDNELSAFNPDQIVSSGADILLPARHARAWALIVHELATNAAKYGALSRPDGKVFITWFNLNDTIDFLWFEPGGQRAVQPTPTRGFGTKLIDAMVRSINGKVTRTFDSDGLKCAIVVPLEELRPTQRPHVRGPAVGPPPDVGSAARADANNFTKSRTAS